MLGRDPFEWTGGLIDERFEVEQVVGVGPHGVVYRSQHPVFAEPVAVNCLRVPPEIAESQRDEILAALRSEAQVFRGLSRLSDSIVRPVDVGAAVSPAGVWTPYMATEWLDGISLAAEMEQRTADGLNPMGVRAAMDRLAPAVAGLGVAHAEGHCHRNLKPANLFVTTRAGQPSLVILDFGVAAVLDLVRPARDAPLAGSDGALAFTPAYAAPEHFSSKHGAVGPWTDVYALALVLIELAAGRPAVRGESLIDFYLAAAQEQQRPTLKASGLAAPEQVEAALARALEVDPTRRYPSALEMWSTLESACRDAQLAPAMPTAAAAGGHGTAPLDAPATTPNDRSRSRPAEDAEAAGENRVCTVMFADISGFTALSERLDPEPVKEIIDHCFDILTGCIEALGGSIDKFIGDCIMAVFGLHRSTANDTERAVLAALAMQQAIAEFTLPQRALRRFRLSLSIGVNTGRVFVGPVGGSGRQELTVIGDPVNVAARLQTAAPAGAIVIGRDTQRQVAGLFDVERLEPVTAKGKRHPLVAYRVLAPRSTDHVRTLPDFHGLATSFVGRASVMEQLEGAFASAESERQGTLATVVGEAGVGRSRILAELAACRTGQKGALLHAACSPMLTDTSYGLAAILLRQHFGLDQDAPADVVKREVRQRLVAIEADRPLPSLGSTSGHPSGVSAAGYEDLEELLMALLRVLGAVPTTSAASSMTPDERGGQIKARITQATARLVQGMEPPVTILVDDAHWADDASLDLLDELVRRADHVGLTVVCTAVPALYERRPLWGEGKRSHLRVDVPPLTRLHLEQMVRDRLRRVEPLSEEFVGLLVDRAEGIPLTLDETLHLLVDAGAIATGDGPWSVHEERLGELTLPTTIQGIVQARLDRLGDEQRSMLSRAAVVGRTFWDGVVRRLGSDQAHAGAAGTGTLLRELRDKRLIHARERSTFPEEREFVFADTATREVAYATLSLKIRRQLHAIAAGWLEMRAGGDANAALLAHHRERAGQLRNAALAYATAASRAAELGENTEALRHFERARSILELSVDDLDLDGPSRETFVGWVDVDDMRVAAWQERAQLYLELGDVLRRIGRLPEAESYYEKARQAIVRQERRQDRSAEPADALRWDARVDYRLALAQELRGAVDKSRPLVERAIERSDAAGAATETAEMWALLAALHLREEDFEQCREVSRRGLRVCRGATGRDDLWRQAASKLLITLGSSFYGQGRMIPAERCYLQAARMCDESRNPELASRALNNVAGVRFAQGDLPGAQDAFRRVLGLAQRTGDLKMVAISLSNLAEAELGLEQAALAQEHAHEAIRLAEQAGTEADLPDMYRNLAEACRALGEYRSALEAGRKALELARQGGGLIYLAVVATSLARTCQAVAEVADAADPVLEEMGAAAQEIERALGAHLDGSEQQARADECRALLHGIQR